MHIFKAVALFFKQRRCRHAGWWRPRGKDRHECMACGKPEPVKKR